MKRFNICSILLFLIFNICFAKFEIIETQKSNSLDYPIYTITVKTYNKETDFQDFFNYAKEIIKNEGVKKITINLILENDKNYIYDRINLDNNRYLVLTPTGIIYEYSEEEFLKNRIPNKNNENPEKEANKTLKYDVASKEISGISRLTIRVKLNKKSTSIELSKISKDIYKLYKDEVIINPKTNKKSRIDNIMIFYYLSHQNVNSNAYASFEVVDGDVNEKFIKNN